MKRSALKFTASALFIAAFLSWTAIKAVAMPPPVNVSPWRIDFGLTSTTGSFKVENYDDTVRSWNLRILYRQENGTYLQDNEIKWLSVDTDSISLGSSNEKTVNVSVDRQGLEYGTYKAVIGIAQPDRDDDFDGIVWVTMSVPEEGQVLLLERSLFLFTSPRHTESELRLANTGDSSLTWEAGEPEYSSNAEGWVTFKPSKGTIGWGETDSTLITVNREGLTPGLYMYFQGFIEQRYGYACAIGLLLFCIILVLTIVNQKYVRVAK